MAPIKIQLMVCWKPKGWVKRWSKSPDCRTPFSNQLAFGEGDHFTQSIARLLKSFLGFFFLPGEGQVLLQPLWIDDFVTALLWSMDMPETINQVIEIGGPEQLTYREIAQLVGQALGKNPKFLNITPVQYSFLHKWLRTTWRISNQCILDGLPGWKPHYCPGRYVQDIWNQPSQDETKLTHLKGKQRLLWTSAFTVTLPTTSRRSYLELYPLRNWRRTLQ